MILRSMCYTNMTLVPSVTLIIDKIVDKKYTFLVPSIYLLNLVS